MTKYECALCNEHACRNGVDCHGVAEEALRGYLEADSESRKLMEIAARVEAEGYMRWPRALEIIRFAGMAGFTHLGVAFCIGLSEEARTYVELLSRTFAVSSVCCKICSVSKSDVGLPRLRPDSAQEVMCSPMCQAELLNRAGTELNVAMGLCVGHDAVFARHSAAPVTTLIAKDRVLGHNPAAALYSGYWKKRLSAGLGLPDAGDGQATEEHRR